MKVKIPVLRKCYAEENTGFYDYFASWEIGLPEPLNRHDSSELITQSIPELLSCIALALLIPHANKKNEVIEKIISQKLVGRKANIKQIVQCIRSYNCFLNRKSCFYNENFKTFINDFKINVEKYIQDNPDKFEDLPAIFNDNVELINLEKLKEIIHACSLMLERRILVILKSINDNLKTTLKQEDIVIFPLKQSNFKWKDTLILYRIEAGSKSWIHFGLPEGDGTNLQRKAFCKILRGMGKDDTKAMELYDTPNARQNFIIALLKSGNTNAVKELFSYHSHTLTKLSEAGFTVDPFVRVTEMDKNCNNYPTAFYYAMMCPQNVLLTRVLYDHATKRFNLIEGSPRLPNDVFLINLIELKRILKEARGMIPSNRSDVVHMADDFISFHEFMTEMTCHIYIEQLRKMTCKDEEKVTELRGKMLWGIVEVYLKYFHIEKEKVECKFSKLYGKYVDHPVYYMNLDFHSAVVLFDHCFAAKESLELEDNLYNTIESVLIRYAFIFRCYNRITDDVMFKSHIEVADGDIFKKYSIVEANEQSNAHKTVSKQNKICGQIMALVTHRERIKLEKSLREFLEKLQEKIPNCTKRAGMTKQEVYVLKEEPVIKDEFLLQYLKSYNNAIDSLTKFDPLAIVIPCIERSLQVIGELIRPEPSEDLTFLKAVLLSILPVNMTQDLKQIRNSLCVYESKQLNARIQRIDLHTLWNLKRDLGFVYGRIIDTISNIHECRMHEFILKSALDNLKDCEEFCNNSAVPEYQKRNSRDYGHNFEKEVRSDSTVDTKTSGILQFSYQEAVTMLSSQREENKRSLKSAMSKSLFKTCFENTLSWIERSIETHDEGPEYTVSRFSCLKLLLTQLIKDGAFDEVKRQQLLHQLDENTENFKINEKDHENLKEQLKNKRLKCGEFVSSVLRDMEMTELNVRPISNFESCKYIHTFKIMLKGQPYATRNFKNKLFRQIKKECNKYKKKKKLSEVYRKRTSIEAPLSKQYDSSIDICNLELDISSENESGSICRTNEADVLRNMFDLYKKIKNELEKHELNENTYSNVCDHFSLTSKQDDILRTLVREQGKTQNIKAKISKFNKEDKRAKKSGVTTKQKLQHISLEFFYSRVKTLKEILIDPYFDIKRLWENAKSLEAKGFLKDKLIRQYMKTPKLRAAVEMLLFDCISVVKGWNKEMSTLWKKTNRALNGINFRNVLAHGNRLLEAIDTILDPEDLPSEIITKVLDLVADIECLKAMCELKKETEADDWETFISYVNNEDEKYKSLRDKIIYAKDRFFRDRPSDKWMKYAKLIPMRKKQPLDAVSGITPQITC